MMYTEIVLPTGFDQVTISGVVAGSEPQVIATNASGLIELQPNDYTELIFSFGEQVVNKSLDIVVKSKLRDPEIVYNSDDVSQNSFRNTLEGTCERFNRDGTKDADMELTQDWASATMLPLELSVEPTKTSTYSGKMNSGGDSGSFTIGVRRHLSDDENSPSEYDIDIPQFKMVDVLPEGVLLVGEPKMSPEFAACPGAKVSTLFGYGNIKERVVIIYEADVLKKDVTTVGTIETELDMLIKGGMVNNTTYMSFDRENTIIKVPTKVVLYRSLLTTLNIWKLRQTSPCWMSVLSTLLNISEQLK